MIRSETRTSASGIVPPAALRILVESPTSILVTLAPRSRLISIVRVLALMPPTMPVTSTCPPAESAVIGVLAAVESAPGVELTAAEADADAGIVAVAAPVAGALATAVPFIAVTVALGDV